jgi:beta-mannosidase
VLIWQDFSLQWSYKREVLPIARDQIRRMVRLLYNHPCIALWCCHNEAIYLVDTKDEDFANIAKSAFSIFGWSWNRNVMDEELLKAVKEEDPTRFVNRSSGEPALFKKGGDTHFYFGWYRVQGPKRTFDKIIKIAPKNLRFVTEFGAQSFPNLESSTKFMDENIAKIDWEKLQNRNSLQIDLMEHWIGLKRKSLENLIEASQEYQARINQYYIDRIRWKKYEPGGGVVPFMFNDPNPAIQWSIVDYWRVPKKSYYAMQTALAPQYCFVLLKKDCYQTGETIGIPIYAVNDAKESFEKVHIDMTLKGPEGLKLTERGFDLFLPQDCMAIQVATVPLALEKPGTYTLTLDMTHPKFSLTNDYPVEVK